MNKTVMFFVMASLSGVASAATLCSGSSAGVAIDTTPNPRIAAASEAIRYSSAWNSTASGATAEVAVNGTVVNSAAGSGAYTWTPTRNGIYTLTHNVKVGGEQVGETLTATFLVVGLNPENPVISPASGTIIEDSLTVVMTCPSEGATIYYTLDGSEPTMESTAYTRKFRITEKTTVKARAFYENGEGSDTVVAEYALGQCPDPVIVSAGGTTFLHKDNVVSIGWSCADGVLRYTTDGGDPTASSPVYAGPFEISESTMVKAKAFGETYLDSSIVTANLVRAWENVASPVINAAESFSGSKTVVVSISCANDGAMIRYTLDGSEPNSHSTRYSGPFEVRATTTVKAYAILDDYANSAVATKTITKVWQIGDSLGMPDHPFTTDGDADWVDDGTAMKSGAITHNEESVLRSEFIGKGTLSFELKTSCEEDDPDWVAYDHCEVWINDALAMKRDGIHDWTEYSFDLGEETNKVEWIYVKDDIEEAGEDCIWVRNVVWMPDYTQTTPVPVPFTWLKEKYPSLGSYYFAYEEKGNSAAANGGNTVWECYVAGLDPTKAGEKFRTVISLAGDEVQIGWEPKLPPEEEALRTYTIFGREKLDEGTWTTPATSAHRFFKVTVQMK